MVGLEVREIGYEYLVIDHTVYQVLGYYRSWSKSKGNQVDRSRICARAIKRFSPTKKEWTCLDVDPVVLFAGIKHHLYYSTEYLEIKNEEELNEYVNRREGLEGVQSVCEVV